MTPLESVGPQLERFQRISLVVGGIALANCLLFGGFRLDQVMHSYLLAYIYWLSIPLGCMAILMLHHLTGGWWGYPIRRLLEAGTRTFPVMAALFIPVLLGMKPLYPWAAHPDEFAGDPNFHFKMVYLNPKFFMLRAIIYFAIWLTIANFLNRWSSEQDRTADPKFLAYFEAFSGPGLILWGVGVTFSAVDWVMSLEPHWFSTIYGMVFMVVEALLAMAFVVLVLRRISDDDAISKAVTPSQFNDLGNLMLAFVMLWAYLSFSQFLIIWSGNLKEEIPWYMSRAFGGWGAIAVVLMVLHFALPFLLLLQRGVKRRLRTLSVVAAMIIVLSLVDIYWLVAPAYEPSPRVHPLDILAVTGIGGIWIGAFLSQLRKWPLLPLHDPRFEGAAPHA